METDGPLKLLFRRYPQDILSLTGDIGAHVQRAGPVELQALIIGGAAPGLVALVPLMRGGMDWNVLETAARRIESAFPDIALSDAEDVLLALAGRDYTYSDLARLVGRHRMIQSSLYTEGRADGRIEGRLQAERELCAALAAKHHAAVMDRLRVKIEACDDPARLKEWALAASDMSDTDFLNLVGA